LLYATLVSRVGARGARFFHEFCSTKDRGSPSLSPRRSAGIPDDGGLHPPAIPFVAGVPAADRKPRVPEISFEVARIFLGGEIPEPDLRKIVADAITFDARSAGWTTRLRCSRLFHGPRCVQGFGAFMAGMMAYITRGQGRLYGLVATSVTRERVAVHSTGCRGCPWSCCILGRVSQIQESQLTPLGERQRLEIGGRLTTASGRQKAFRTGNCAGEPHIGKLDKCCRLPPTFN